MSTDTDIDMWLSSALLRSDSASGLLRLEELVRRFLISRETLSVRMLDDNLDPTPLLKEIRDDKVATIIIDANASVSYLILKKVSSNTSVHTLVPAHTNTHIHKHTHTLAHVRAFVLQLQKRSGICTIPFHVPIWEIRIVVMKGAGSLTSVK